MSLLVLVACAHCNSWGFALGHPPLSYCPLCYSSLLSWGSLAPEGVQPREVKTPGLLLFNSFITSPFFKLTHRSSWEFTQFGPGAKAAPEPCYTSLHCTCTVPLLCTCTAPLLCTALALLHFFAVHSFLVRHLPWALTDSPSHSAQ